LLQEQGKVSSEEVVIIHYTFALKKPKLEQEQDQEEWIKCVKMEYKFEDEKDKSAYLMTGLFNGVVNLYDSEYNLKHSLKAHEGVVNDA
jgi:hypothetical protein